MQEHNDQDEQAGIDWRDLGKRAAIFALLLIAALVILPRTEAPEAVRDAQTAQVLARKKAGALDEALATRWKELGLAEGAQPTLAYVYDGPALARPLILDKWQHSAKMKLVDTPASPDTAQLVVTVREQADTLRITAAHVEHGQRAEVLKADRLVGRWWSVLPPLIAVLMAICFRSLLIALFSAIWIGSALQTGLAAPHLATWMALRTYLVGTTLDTFNLYIIGFTISLVGAVHIILKMGGLAGLLERVKGLASSTRSTQVATGLMGLAVFFDDYANTIVIGSTMRPLTDHLKISREKLAYLVDSTSAPVAGLAIISTWIGYEVGLFTELSTQLGLGRSGYDIFFDILPLRFYCIFALALVFIVGLSGRDFGPMLAAERRARHKGQLLRPGARPLTNIAAERLEPPPGIPLRWFNAVIPIALMLTLTMLGMYWSGWSGTAPGPTSIPGLGQEGDMMAAWSAAAGGMGSWQTWRDAFSSADNAKVLFWGAALTSVIAFVMATTQRLLTPRVAALAWARAVPGMWMAIAILMHAWAIRAVCDDLGTSIYLVGAVQDLIAPQLLPIITFLLAAAIAFATGTSWGTMGLLLPAMIPLAYQLTLGLPDADLLVLLCFGAVLDGAIFGDHCSPISDTTVMSSIASACDHIDHVRTQIPYALLTMLAAALIGYIAVAFGLPTWIALPSGIASLVAFMFVVGRRADDALGASEL
jgi:Na+/H+ antiporter NhaC